MRILNWIGADGRFSVLDMGNRMLALFQAIHRHLLGFVCAIRGSSRSSTRERGGEADATGKPLTSESMLVFRVTRCGGVCGETSSVSGSRDATIEADEVEVRAKREARGTRLGKTERWVGCLGRPRRPRCGAWDSRVVAHAAGFAIVAAGVDEAAKKPRRKEGRRDARENAPSNEVSGGNHDREAFSMRSGQTGPSRLRDAGA